MKIVVIVEGIDTPDVKITAFKNRHGAVKYFEKAKKSVLMQEVKLLNDNGREFFFFEDNETDNQTSEKKDDKE